MKEGDEVGPDVSWELFSKLLEAYTQLLMAYTDLLRSSGLLVEKL